MLTGADIDDRISRGRARFVIAEASLAERFGGHDIVRFTVRGSAPGWRDFGELLKGSPVFTPDGPTGADDPLLLYFTSGTTARPKLVLHSHASYPVGHLSTMFGLGLKPGDSHLNISSPGWAKHAGQRVRALERRRLHPGDGQKVRRARHARRPRRARGDFVLRAADRLAPARAAAARKVAHVAARTQFAPASRSTRR